MDKVADDRLSDSVCQLHPEMYQHTSCSYLKRRRLNVLFSGRLCHRIAPLRSRHTSTWVRPAKVQCAHKSIMNHGSIFELYGDNVMIMNTKNTFANTHLLPLELESSLRILHVQQQFDA